MSKTDSNESSKWVKWTDAEHLKQAPANHERTISPSTHNRSQLSMSDINAMVNNYVDAKRQERDSSGLPINMDRIDDWARDLRESLKNMRPGDAQSLLAMFRESPDGPQTIEAFIEVANNNFNPKPDSRARRAKHVADYHGCVR